MSSRGVGKQDKLSFANQIQMNKRSPGLSDQYRGVGNMWSWLIREVLLYAIDYSLHMSFHDPFPK